MPGYGLLPADEGSGLLPWTWLSQRMASARNYWLATADGEGQPHAAPVWGVWHEETFYFSTSRTSRKGRNLLESGWGVVHLESGDEVVIIEGAIKPVPDVDADHPAAQAYRSKYQVPLAEQSTFCLKPQVAFGWVEAEFPGTATRWRL
jgi:pyridoxine/pyridoxamine 5'-phosphate oxidase